MSKPNVKERLIFYFGGPPQFARRRVKARGPGFEVGRGLSHATKLVATSANFCLFSCILKAVLLNLLSPLFNFLSTSESLKIHKTSLFPISYQLSQARNFLWKLFLTSSIDMHFKQVIGNKALH